jgi:murein DD-endopeptidase MepM/ murein hydrolase activator NlpD
MKRVRLGLSVPKAILLSITSLFIVTIIAWPSSQSSINQTPLNLKAGAQANNDISSFKDKLNIKLSLPSEQTEESQQISVTSLFDQSVQNDLNIVVKSGDTLGQLFSKNNLSYSDMLAILSEPIANKYLARIKPDDVLVIKALQSDGKIEQLSYSVDIENSLVIKRNETNDFKAVLVNSPLEKRIAYSHGTIRDSLFLAGMEAGLADSLIMNLAGIFQWDIDFVQDIRKNDSFTVLYEQLWKNGEFVGNGAILAAEFINKGESFHAIRFVDENNESNYFAPDGKSMRKAFLRAPIAFSPRVTSNFNPRRYHPVHKKVRPHRGVDYGGPIGTPILAAGDGKVIFRGRKGGYGNTVILQHGGNITTLYAHLSKFNRNVRSGSRVKQGQTIGYLGATGTVTAKHLHYEYRLNGAHRNPRTVKLPNAKALPSKYKSEFEQSTSSLLAQLDVIKRAKTALTKQGGIGTNVSATIQ